VKTVVLKPYYLFFYYQVRRIKLLVRFLWRKLYTKLLQRNGTWN